MLILVIDATEGITDQDVRLARLVESNDRAMVIVCNKWDAAAKLDKHVPAFVRDNYRRYPFLEFAPMVFTSAVTGDGVDHILPAAARAGVGWHANFQTALLNRILAETVAMLDPPLVGRRRLKLMYVTQIGSAPPRLAFFTNIEHDIPAHYIRFLEGPLPYRARTGERRYATAARISSHRPVVGRVAPSAGGRSCAGARQRTTATSRRHGRSRPQESLNAVVRRRRQSNRKIDSRIHISPLWRRALERYCRLQRRSMFDPVVRWPFRDRCSDVIWRCAGAHVNLDRVRLVQVRASSVRADR